MTGARLIKLSQAVAAGLTGVLAAGVGPLAAQVTELVPLSVVYSNITPQVPTNVFTFSATNAGLAAFFVGSSVPDRPIFDIYAPDGGLIRSSPMEGNQTLETTQAGLYTLVCHGATTNETVQYCLLFVRNPQWILPGQTLTNNAIEAEGDTDVFIFSGAQGEYVWALFEATSAYCPVPIGWLYAPDGSLIAVAYDNVCHGCRGGIFGGIRLPQTGLYLLQIGRYSTMTPPFTYNLGLTKLPGPNLGEPSSPQGQILPGQTVTNWIDFAADMDVLSINLNSNDTASLFILQVGTGRIEIDIQDPTGAPVNATVLWDGNLSCPDTMAFKWLRFKAATNGEFSLLVRDDCGYWVYPYVTRFIKSPGPNANEPEDGPTRLVPGQAHSGVLEIGDADAYEFDAIAGDSVLISMGRNPGEVLELWAPDGEPVSTDPQFDEGVATISYVCLPHTGTYQVLCSSWLACPQIDYTLTLTQWPLVPESSGVNQWLVAYQCTDGHVYVRWSTNSANFLLESSPTVVGGAWQPMTNTPVAFEGHFYMDEGLPVGTKFYRLICTNPPCGNGP